MYNVYLKRREIRGGVPILAAGLPGEAAFQFPIMERQLCFDRDTDSMSDFLSSAKKRLIVELLEEDEEDDIIIMSCFFPEKRMKIDKMAFLIFNMIITNHCLQRIWYHFHT
jgi:hypothetical protein